MNTKIKYLIVSLLCLVAFGSISQKSRNQYEQEKKALLQKISDANKILDQTQKKKKATQGQLNVLNEQVKNQTYYINSLSAELSLIQSGLKDSQNKLQDLSFQIENLKKEYANTVYQTYKTKNSFNTLTYIFTSPSFNQMLMRLNFLKQYRKARILQVDKIDREKQNLETKKTALSQQEKEKMVALRNLKNEKEQLGKLKERQASVLQELAQEEGELVKQLQEYKKEQARLEQLIKKAIEDEIAKREKPASNSVTLKERQQEVALSQNFAANKGRLPWPVAKAFVSRNFGKHPHPVLKDVTIDNMGVGLQTEQDAAVRSVFDGKVTTVAKIPGMNYVVMVKHGSYFTVYARLKKVYVEPGQDIKVKDAIGLVSTDAEGKSEMEFQVWKDREKENPLYWLHK